MRDPKAGKYQVEYFREFIVAERILKPYPGRLEWATDDYVAFRYRDERACIVFYPRKSTTGNWHLRVRSQGSAEPQYARDIMIRLDVGAGHNPTFCERSDEAGFEARSRFISRTQTKPGWAAQGIL
jgi:hypothetical protein